MAVNNNATLIRQELLTRIIDLFLKQNLADMDRIPLLMRPKKGDSIRCCIYKDRAVLKYKILGILGYDSVQETDELKPLSSYFNELLAYSNTGDDPLTVVGEACSSCHSGNYVVTNMCRGCVGRSCMINCKKDAIEIRNGQAYINHNTCINCGICQKSCPYHAIIYTPVPCEESCPVNAISKDAEGKEHIDFQRCIYCGKCIESCPFGAIVEYSHIFKVIQNLMKNNKTIAIVAPAIAGQFNAGLPNILQSIKQLGFFDVVEAAEGAELTTINEARELEHKIATGQPFMTTSCCPAYKNLTEKHIRELISFVSETKSPMYYIAEKVKQEHPESSVVFIGPCLAKKYEAGTNKNIDWVINFEELGAFMQAKGVYITKEEIIPERNNASNDSRKYAISGGVTHAVIKNINPEIQVRPAVIHGLNKTEIRNLKKMAVDKHGYNFIEVMSCENGCIGGCNTIVKSMLAKRQLEQGILALDHEKIFN